VRIEEPGADLAIALAVASAASGTAAAAPEAPPLACFGELGLTGELRSVAHADRRIAEARKFGLTRLVTPEAGTLRAALAAVRERSRSPGSPEAVAVC